MRKNLKILIVAFSVAFIIYSSHSYVEEQTIDTKNIYSEDSDGTIEVTDDNIDIYDNKVIETPIKLEIKSSLKSSTNSVAPVFEEISEVDKTVEIKEENQVKKTE